MTAIPYYGITLVGNTTVTGFIDGNKIINNRITDFYSHGLYIAGTVNTAVDGNTFSRPTRTTSASAVYGIQATGTASHRLRISKNRFTNPFGGLPANTNTYYGIHYNSVDAVTGNEDTVVNNLMYGLNGLGPIYGMYNIGSNNVFYYHNTISIDNALSTGTPVSVGFYQTTAATGLRFHNNIVTINRGGTGTKHGIYLATATSEVEANRNDYYINGTNAYAGYAAAANRITVAALAAASGQEANSVAENPLYADSANGNFRPQLALIDNLGAPLDVATDIMNVTRSTTTPDIGAYEFAPTPCAVPLVPGTVQILPSTFVCLETPLTMTVIGHSPLGSVTFQWETSVDGLTNWTAVTPVRYFPEFNTIATISKFFRVKVSCGTTSIYTNVGQVNLSPGVMLPGTYTINSAAPATYVPNVTGGNFQTFNSAVSAMLCGIGGKITFNVLPGTNGVYNEQVRIPYIPGTSATSTVTFQSANGQATSANLSFSGTTANNYTLRLDSTKNFIFKNLSFTAQNATNGRVIELFNGANNDSIVGSIIDMPAVTANSNAVAGVFANASKGDNLIIKGNTINRGSSGIWFSGTSATALTGINNVIDSNKVVLSYSDAINVQFARRVSITRNTVELSGVLNPNASGIFTNYADSSSKINSNIVTINNVTSASVNGIYVTNTRAAIVADSAIVAGNRILAGAGNTGSVNGVTITASKGVNVLNNVVALNSVGTTGYGLYNLNNVGDINYYNNTINVTSASANAYPGYFEQNAATAIFNVKNNIFSNKGGGRALFVNNPVLYLADYNMLYSSGPVLTQVTSGPFPTFANLAAWKNIWNWDVSSISYEPAFADNIELRPNLTSPAVWAMHGRGVQIRNNTYDFDNKRREDVRQKGVPDLGAYEFFPTSLPSILTATPATPLANSTQTFSYGTDTVMKITWQSVVPASINIRRYSGVVPAGLPAGMDSMFFYTEVEVPGVNDYRYNAKLYYVDSWQGSIPAQNRIGLGRTTPANAWIVGANSTINVAKKEIGQDGLLFLGKFTGLVNPFAQPEEEDGSSNRGKDFWVGYQRSNGFDVNSAAGGNQTMKIYMGAGAVEAHVTITIENDLGTPWVRNYTVPANSAITSEDIPKLNADDARLITEGLYKKKGIHIISDVAIVAYAHIYESTNSGATMLMPAAVWGYEYYTLSSRQNYTSTSYSAFHIVAQHDSTWVEINPSLRTLAGWVPNGGTRPNGSYLVKLNKGDAYQVLGANQSGAEGNDLTGSYVKSVGNNQSECFPIAVFAGSTRTGIGCVNSPGSSGDLIIQQIFPYQAWGNKYATAPLSMIAGPSATTNMTNTFRIMVKDPTTIVKVNNNALPVSSLIAGKYYQIETNVPNYIEANRSIMVAQYMSSASNCGNTGNQDPEMFYLSPLQQSIKSTQFYRNSRSAIGNNFITLIIPTEGLNTLRIDGVNYLAYNNADRYIYPHPNLPGYSVVTKKWAAGEGSSFVESESPFTGVVYGMGSAESYGYNIGTLVRNLNVLSSVNTTFNTGANPTDYTCAGAPFTVTVLLPLQPTSILWQFSQVTGLSPNVDSLQTNPVPVNTVVVDGETYYAYTVQHSFVLNATGTVNIPVIYTSPLIEKCTQSETGKVVVQILPAPVTDFSIAFPGSTLAEACVGATGTFTGNLITENGVALNQWNWTFPTTTPTGRIQNYTFATAGTFPIKLQGVTADGCVSEKSKDVKINALPVVGVTLDSVAVCAGATNTFTVNNPVTGTTYNWYTLPQGGTLAGTGTSFTPPVTATLPAVYYVEAVSASLCNSATRKKVTMYQLPNLLPTTITATSTPLSITFTWTPVTGASSYQVSVDGGTTYTTPSSGPSGLTHTVNGLVPSTEVTLIVKAIGTIACQTSTSLPVTGKTLLDQVFIPNSFTPNGDGRNDELKVYGYVIAEMRFVIFNQWGEKIAETKNAAMDASGGHIVWDGRHKGDIQPSGVYMYVARIVLLNGTILEKKGAINLIR